MSRREAKSSAGGGEDREDREDRSEEELRGANGEPMASATSAARPAGSGDARFFRAPPPARGLGVARLCFDARGEEEEAPSDDWDDFDDFSDASSPSAPLGRLPRGGDGGGAGMSEAARAFLFFSRRPSLWHRASVPAMIRIAGGDAPRRPPGRLDFSDAPRVRGRGRRSAPRSRTGFRASWPAAAVRDGSLGARLGHAPRPAAGRSIAGIGAGTPRSTGRGPGAGSARARAGRPRAASRAAAFGGDGKARETTRRPRGGSATAGSGTRRAAAAPPGVTRASGPTHMIRRGADDRAAAPEEATEGPRARGFERPGSRREGFETAATRYFCDRGTPGEQVSEFDRTARHVTSERAVRIRHRANRRRFDEASATGACLASSISCPAATLESRREKTGCIKSVFY